MKIKGLTIGKMQINFAKNLTDKEIKDEIKKYRNFYKNKYKVIVI